MEMSQIILLFILLMSASLEIVKSSVELDSHSDDGNFDFPSAKFTRCHPYIPGLDKMQSGIDITQVEFAPKDDNAPNGYRKQLYELTCNGNVPWTNEYSSKDYVLPDELEHPRLLPVTSSSKFDRLTRGCRQFQQSLSEKLGLSASYEGVGLGFSGSVKDAEKNFFNNSAYIHQYAVTSSTYSFSLSKSRMPALTDDFIASVQQLPPNYEDDPAAYQSFIDDFGTHYLDQATMRGRLYQYVEIDTAFANSKSDETIKLSAELSFLEFFKESIGASTVREEELQAFKSSNQIIHVMVGGNQSYFRVLESNSPNSENLISDWIASLNTFPWIVSGRMQPIQNLIKDPNIRSQLEIAQKVYIASTKYGMAERKADFVRNSGKNLDEFFPMGVISDISSYVAKYKMFRDGPINITTVESALEDMDAYLEYMDYVEAFYLLASQLQEAMIVFAAKHNKSSLKIFVDVVVIAVSTCLEPKESIISPSCDIFMEKYKFELLVEFANICEQRKNRNADFDKVIEQARQYLLTDLNSFLGRV